MKTDLMRRIFKLCQFPKCGSRNFAIQIVLDIIHVTDIGMLTPVGVNIGTILPIPVINRWIYQFYDEGNGAAAEFYNTMRPYFVPTHICVCIIALFLFVSIYAIIKIYNRREI